MNSERKRKRTNGIHFIVVLYLIDAAIALVRLMNGTPYIGVNGIGLGADLVAIAGLWSMKRWGAAFTIIASGKGIGQSIMTLQIAYLDVHNDNLTSSFFFDSVALPLLTIATDIFIVIYLFTGIFEGRFESRETAE